MGQERILILDNYDSFTYNLAHYVGGLTGVAPVVKRHDRITVDEAARYRRIILSPGPGLPHDAGILRPLVEACYRTSHVLGVCLGMQAIGEVFGGRLKRLAQVQHGVARAVTVTDPGDPLFRDLPTRFMAARYHSWALDPHHLPEDLAVTATGPGGEVMAITHRHYPVRGVQFHPESVLTPEGRSLLRNWIDHCMQPAAHGL